MQSSDIVVFLSTFFWLIAASILVFAILDDGPEDNTLLVCGTIDVEYRYTDQRASLGKSVWNANACGACHHISMTQYLTDPALQGVMDRFRRDTLALVDWLHDSQNYLLVADTSRYLPNFKDQDGNRIVMSSYSALTYEEVQALVAYIER